MYIQFKDNKNNGGLKMAFNKKTRKEVYKKYNGHCAYCGKEIEIKDMQIDHMWSKSDGESYARIFGKVELESIENYMPTCRRCNNYKSRFSLEHWRSFMLDLNERALKQITVKVGIDFGIIKVEKFDGKFYFEKVNGVTNE